MDSLHNILHLFLSAEHLEIHAIMRRVTQKGLGAELLLLRCDANHQATVVGKILPLICSAAALIY